MSRLLIQSLVLLMCLGMLGEVHAATANKQGEELFKSTIQPIFVENCHKCHSHNADKIKGSLLVDSPNFPAPHKEEASKGKLFLDALRGVDDLEWTMLSPSALFVAGERTGTFRLGGDSLLTASDGRSWISYEDYAVAMLDEIEQPKHARRRFTVGY